MILWWIGNLILLLVIAPVVIILLNRVLGPIREIKAYADDVLEHGGNLTATLDAIDKLNTTRELTRTARQSAGRYGAALQRMLG